MRELHLHPKITFHDTSVYIETEILEFTLERTGPKYSYKLIPSIFEYLESVFPDTKIHLHFK